MRKKKRNTVFRDLLTLCLTVALVLVMPQPVYAAGNKPTSMTLNMSHKTIDLNSTYQIKVKTVKRLRPYSLSLNKQELNLQVVDNKNQL